MMIFIVNSKFSLKYSVVSSVLLTAMIAMVFDLEIFPFAPYTMYSYPYYLKRSFQLEVLLVGPNGLTTPAKDMDVYPWDEARLKVYLGKMLDQGDQAKISETLREVLEKQPAQIKAIIFEKQEWLELTMDNFLNPQITKISEVSR